MIPLNPTTTARPANATPSSRPAVAGSPQLRRRRRKRAPSNVHALPLTNEHLARVFQFPRWLIAGTLPCTLGAANSCCVNLQTQRRCEHQREHDWLVSFAPQGAWLAATSEYQRAGLRFAIQQVELIAGHEAASCSCPCCVWLRDANRVLERLGRLVEAEAKQSRERAGAAWR